MGSTDYSFYPFAIGLGYLLPLDLLFSSWFFYFFWKAQLVISAANAWDTVPNFPFITQQAFGGFFAILTFMFWNGRHYFRQVWEKIWNAPSDVSDDGEGLALSDGLPGYARRLRGTWSASWSGRECRLWLAVAAFLIYFLVSLTVTRIRAELGPPMHDLHFSGPDLMLTTSLGNACLLRPRPDDAFLLLDARPRLPLPPAANRDRGTSKSLSNSVHVAADCLLGPDARRHLSGRSAPSGRTCTSPMPTGNRSQIRQRDHLRERSLTTVSTAGYRPRHPPEPRATMAMGVGFLFCTLLFLARLRFPWWPFHPIGYAVSSSYVINLVWMPLFIAWVAKSLILTLRRRRACTAAPCPSSSA